MMLNDEQIDAHFREFCEFFDREVRPDLENKQPMSDYESGFNMGRCFEKLWQDKKACIECQFLEDSGQLDV